MPGGKKNPASKPPKRWITSESTTLSSSVPPRAHASSFAMARESAGRQGSPASSQVASAAGAPAARQRAKPGLDARGVRVERRPDVGPEALRLALAEECEAEHARLAVQGQRVAPLHLGEPAAGGAPEPGQLAGTVLRVHEAEAEPGVALARRAHVRDAAPVAQDLERAPEAGHLERAARRRLHRARVPALRELARADEEHRRRGDAEQEPAEARAPLRPCGSAAHASPQGNGS